MKERLTGAIILVALMVLLVPELLTGPIRTTSVPAASVAALSAPVAAHAQPPLRTYTLTLGAPPQAHEAIATPAAEARPGDASQDTPAPPPGDSPPEQAARAPTESPDQGKALPSEAASGAPAVPPPGARTPSGLQVAKPPAHPSVQEASAPASARGWVVQLGSFADRQNAVRLARSLEARGFRMSVSSAKAGSRVLWRVRAGPARDRAGAQHLATRLRALGHRGEILPAR